MSVRHHPDDIVLLDHAAGRLDPAMALMIATHLSFCPECRAQVTAAERIGGVLLDQTAPVPLAQDALSRTLARLDDNAAAPMPAASNDNTPAPLRAYLGRDLSQMRWRKLGPRLGYITLHRQGPLTLRLLRGAPGSDVGHHSHRGQEFTLVLRGGYADETGRYGPGDFQTATAAVMHNPIADPGEDCINLSLTTGRLHFAGLMPKLAGWVFGF